MIHTIKSVENQSFFFLIIRNVLLNFSLVSTYRISSLIIEGRVCDPL